MLLRILRAGMPACLTLYILQVGKLSPMSSMQMDLSVVVIVILVWSLYFVLKTFFFDPINHILSKRHAAIEGTQQQAKEQLTEVDKQSKVYAKAIKEARLESYRKQRSYGRKR
jgi:F0F1-type ATP synthase membrane subunit b/b'